MSTQLQERIESGKPLLLAEMAPPKSGDPQAFITAAKQYAGQVHALGISDNRDGVRMSALAAAALATQQKVEPLLHMVTRDRNRIALISDSLGAQALGIRNLLCTTGTHQTLGPARQSKNVFDIDSMQLMKTLGSLAKDASLLGEASMNGSGPFCLGGTATPFADPMELQILRLKKKVAAGARFLITQPIFDLERFRLWMTEVKKQGIAQKVALVAGIRVLTDAKQARTYAEGRPSPRIPEAILQRLAAKSDDAAQRAEGIAVAVETVKQVQALDGIRGFEIRGDGDDAAALEVMKQAGLGVN